MNAVIFDPEAIRAKSATLSGDELYRYDLERVWAPGAESLVFVMLNPSTADAMNDDPTIRRCIGFAKRFGYGGIVVLNLFAYRATDPADLMYAMNPGGDITTDIVGPMNDRVLEAWLNPECSSAPDVCLAWGALGAHSAYKSRVAEVIAMVPDYRGRVYCLGRTAAGQPKHPLYLSNDTRLEGWW